MKKIITMLLSLAMVITMMPAMAITAFAGEGTGTLADLQDIVNKAENGSTIVLEKDYAPGTQGGTRWIRFNNEEDFSRNITIDLNGHSIKSDSYCFWVESEQENYQSTLTLIDSKGTGFLQKNTTDNAAAGLINVEENGCLIAKGVTFKGNSSNPNENNGFYAIGTSQKSKALLDKCLITGVDIGIRAFGTVTIKDTTITNTFIGIDNRYGKVILENCKITENKTGITNRKPQLTEEDVFNFCIIAINDTEITNNETGLLNQWVTYLGGDTRIINNSIANICLQKVTRIYPEEDQRTEDYFEEPAPVTLGENKGVESLDNYVVKKPTLGFKAGTSILEYDTRYTKTITIEDRKTHELIQIYDPKSIEIVKDGEPIGGAFLTNGNALNAKLFFADNSEYKINYSDGQLELISEAEANKLLVKKAIKGTIVAATCICYIKNLQKLVKVQGVVHNLKTVNETIKGQLVTLNTVFKGAKAVLTFAQFKLAINNLLGFKQFESR